MSFPDIFDKVETWVFDLDNTLYPATSKVFDQISRRMTGFISEHFDIAPDAALAKQRDFFMRYGTTLRGLMTEHGLKPGPFLDYVHDHHFEEIFDIAAADYIPKPDRTSYAMMLRKHGVVPGTACMIEDMAVNLEPAKAIGMSTVWLKGEIAWARPKRGAGIPRYIDFVADDLASWLDGVIARREIPQIPGEKA
jgi:putative hydrolase of the HAD superfamily